MISFRIEHQKLNRHEHKLGLLMKIVKYYQFLSCMVFLVYRLISYDTHCDIYLILNTVIATIAADVIL